MAATWDSPAPQPPLPPCDNPRSDKGLISALSPNHGQSVQAGGLQPAASAQPAGDPARPRAARAAQCNTERSARMRLGVLVVRKKNNQGTERRGSSSCRALPALISTCTVRCRPGESLPRGSGGGANYGERNGTGEERGERGERSERSARRGRGSRREPGQAERHREGESGRRVPVLTAGRWCPGR